MKARRPSIWFCQDGEKPVQKRDELAREEPLEIRLETRPVTVTMRTPGHDVELAAGFLVSEGVVQSAAQIKRIKPYARNLEGNVLDVFLSETVTVDLKRLSRHVFASASCGLCGKTTLEAVRHRFPATRGTQRVAASMLMSLPDRMRREQETFGRTGGLHAAAVFDLHGDLVVAREDIGRHNAVDKVVGFGLFGNLLPWNRHVLLVSGRASFEIIQKALAAGIPVVAAISAPSSLAVDLARRSGQTLVGFLRGRQLNIYAGHQRVI